MPKLNFDAKCYIVINWQETNFDPPIQGNPTKHELIQIIVKKGDERILFTMLPCHIQAIERIVKLVTEGAMSACDKNKRWYHSCNLLQGKPVVHLTFCVLTLNIEVIILKNNEDT